MFLGALIEYRLCLRVRRGGGGIMSMLQNSWGDYVHVYKFEQGGGVVVRWGGGDIVLHWATALSNILMLLIGRACGTLWFYNS